MPRNIRSHSTKRVRIDDAQQNTDKTSPANSDKVSPTAKAKLELERAIASHPIDMQTLLKTVGIDLLALHSKYFNKKNIVKKMTDEQDYIPRSCRVKFNLDASEDTKKRDPQRIQLLSTQAQAVVSQYQSAMKAVILDVSKEEKKTLKNQVNEAICQAFYKITRAHIASLGQTADTTQMLMNLLEHQDTEKLLQYNIGLSTAQFKQLYKRVHSIQDDLPQPVELAPNHHDEAMQAQVVIANQAQWDRPDMKTLPQLAQLLESAIYLPYHTFITQHSENQRLAELKKVSKEIMTNEATDATAMLVDDETPMNAQQMQDVIKQEVKKATQTLQQQLSQQNKLLQQAIQSSKSKKQQRGQSRSTGASSKKKSKPKKGNTNRNSNRGRSRTAPGAPTAAPNPGPPTPDPGTGTGTETTKEKIR